METFKHFKSIEEALPHLRPGDKLVKVLSNKFAFVEPVYTDGKFAPKSLMGLHNNVIHTYHQNIEYVLSLPNIERRMYCYNHSENGKPINYLFKTIDYRQHKHDYRIIQKLLNHG